MQKNFEFDFEKTNKKGQIIGTDEAGRGPGAGPVYAAAVYFPNISDNLMAKLSSLDDSKKLTEQKREELFDIIIQNSIYSINFSTVEEIEKLNILQASLLAMKKSVLEVQKLAKIQNPHVLIDGRQLIPNLNFSQEYVIKGDSKSASIAAASILAKVSRDRYMKELDLQFPQYGFAKHKGYLTKKHLEAIDKYGLCPYHRPSFLRKHFEKAEQLTLL